MKLPKILLTVLIIGLLGSSAYAKEAAKSAPDGTQKTLSQTGKVKGSISAKEIPQGFVFKSGKGKVTLLILWTQNCKSCVADIPKLNRILLDFKGKVNIIAIELSGMSTQELQKFAKEHKVLYTLVSGVENKKFTARIMEKFGFDKSLPFQIVLGYTGHNNGIIKGISKLKDMEAFLQKIIDHYEQQKTTQSAKQQPTSTEKPKKKLEPIRI